MKKIQLLLLSLLLALPFNGFAQQSTPYGDVNGDNEVNIADVNSIIGVILDGAAVTPAADVNGDGEINIADVNAVIDIILGGAEAPAVVHVYGDDGPTEGRVINVTDGSVTVTCDSGDEPKPGEIIVSGITGQAPVGFLRRVERVQTSGGQCVMTTTNASLEEVIPDGDYDLPVPMQEQGQYVTIQAPGQPPQRVGFSTELKLGVKFGRSGVKFLSNVSAADALEGDEDKTYPVTIVAMLSPSIDVNFIYSSRNKKVQRIGLKGNADIRAEILGKISAEGSVPLLGEDGVKLFTVNLKPVTVMAGYVPIVFTPRIDVYLSADLSGEVYLKSRFVAAQAEGGFSYIYTPTPDPITGKNHNFTTNFSCGALGDGHLSDYLSENFAAKVGINGAITAALHPTLDVSLYGANDIFNVGMPISPWVKAEGNLALTLKKYIELDYDDQVTFSAGVDIGLSAQFKLGKKNLKWKQDITLFETQLYDYCGITPSVANFQISPNSPISPDTKQVRFSMDLTKPFYQLLPDQDYGFAYGLASQSRDTWTYVSLKSQYDTGFTPTNRTQYIETYIDTYGLKKDSTYRVCPYVTIFGTDIYRKGTNFKIEEEGDWVNLGLPSGTIWATRNVGASAPEDYGDYFAWGETAPKSYYDWGTYKWCNGSYYNYTLTKYCTNSGYGYNGFVDNKTELDLEDDAACAHYPGGRMPSLVQIQELCDNCTWQWTQRNGVNGQLVTGPNGNTMFLPAAGGRWRESLCYAGSDGCYWSRTLYSSDPNGAYNLYYFHSFNWSNWGYGDRDSGLTVRAVRVS